MSYGPEFQPSFTPQGDMVPWMGFNSKGDPIPYHATNAQGDWMPQEFMRANLQGDPIPYLGASQQGDSIPYPETPGGNPYSIPSQMPSVRSEATTHRGVTQNEDTVSTSGDSRGKSEATNPFENITTFEEGARVLMDLQALHKAKLAEQTERGAK